MSKYANKVKRQLLSIIKEMGSNPEAFVQQPKSDFKRNRKLNFETMIKLLLSMGGNSVYKELLDYFNYDISTASTSAFV